MPVSKEVKADAAIASVKSELKSISSLNEEQRTTLKMEKITHLPTGFCAI